MKIWKLIIENEDSLFMNSEEDVYEFMYENRIYPCQYEEYEFNRKTIINKLCSENKRESDCSKCLSEYLKIEVD